MPTHPPRHLLSVFRLLTSGISTLSHSRSVSTTKDKSRTSSTYLLPKQYAQRFLPLCSRRVDPFFVTRIGLCSYLKQWLWISGRKRCVSGMGVYGMGSSCLYVESDICRPAGLSRSPTPPTTWAGCLYADRRIHTRLRFRLHTTFLSWPSTPSAILYFVAIINSRAFNWQVRGVIFSPEFLHDTCNAIWDSSVLRVGRKSVSFLLYFGRKPQVALCTSL